MGRITLKVLSLQLRKYVALLEDMTVELQEGGPANDPTVKEGRYAQGFIEEDAPTFRAHERLPLSSFPNHRPSSEANAVGV